MEPTREIADRYDVVRKLGEGASAETFLATDRQDGDCDVVIKSLRVEKIEGWKFFELFEREAQTLQSLNHSGIPNFVESFATKDEGGKPRFHLVQEFIPGRSLETVIEDGGLSRMEFDQLALGLLDILDYLHERTPPIFHRDIKPSNIIVRPMGAPVLIDFGSVCYGWREEMEQGSTVAGTHGYMPPEQYLGQVSARSDLYGLGATLLHVASGRPPSEFSFEEGKLDVPDDLGVNDSVKHAIAQMLQPAPKDRPQTAREARDLLVRGESALVVAGSQALVPLSGAEEGGPRFVDVGDPPRTIAKFKDVYYTLVPKMTSASFGNPASNRQGKHSMVILWTVLTLMTVGIMFIIPLLQNKERNRRKQLFLTGLMTKCRILQASTVSQASSRVTYEYEVDGEWRRGSTDVMPSDASYMMPGDVFGVLYDEKNPTNNVLIYV